MLTLCEELFLLSVHEAKGTTIGFSVDRMKPGLAGAVLAQLALLGNIRATDNHRLQRVGDEATNEPILDEALEALAESSKERKAGYWISNLNSKTEKARKQLVKALIEKGVVTQDDSRLLWVIPSPVPPQAHASTKFQIVERLRRIALAQAPYQPQDIVLLSVLRASDLLELVFLADERKVASQMINELLYSLAINDPVFQTVQEITTAIADEVEED